MKNAYDSADTKSGKARIGQVTPGSLVTPGCLVDVETKNRRYRIETMRGSTVRISGHPTFCPSPVVGPFAWIGRSKRFLRHRVDHNRSAPGVSGGQSSSGHDYEGVERSRGRKPAIGEHSVIEYATWPGAL